MIGAPQPLVALAGNPNTGKSTLFNRLTGNRAKVGNYPGVTVERETGILSLTDGRSAVLQDVPGTYSLAARSADEQLALGAIVGLSPLARPDCVIAVVDATQLERNLYLVLQIIELGVPLVVALNMTDRLEETGQHVDAAELSRELGVPVVPIRADRGVGLESLSAAVTSVLEEPSRGRAGWRWKLDGTPLREDVDRVAATIPSSWHGGDAPRRDALSLWALLSVDAADELTGVPSALREAVEERRRDAVRAGRELELEIIRGRYGWIDEHAPLFLREKGHGPLSTTDRIDRVLLHPAAGMLIFLVLMTVVFQSLFTGADPMIGWVEAVFSTVGESVRAALPPGWWTDLAVDGVITGVGSVVVFLPQILLLFLFIGLMEDTGYMARVAYLMDRVMRVLGLHGRAFVPMLSAYACAIPAILATRTMERRRDRLLTMMVIPLMTCSARLPVYGLLIAALFPPDADAPLAQGLLLAAMYLFSTLVALVVAAVLGRTLLRGPRVPIVMEMPPYRVPHLPTVLRLMWTKSSVFLREAGTVILTCTIAMWALLSFPRNAADEAAFERAAAEEPGTSGSATKVASAEAEQDRIEARAASAHLRQSYGGRVGRFLEPAIEPLGFDWKIGVGILGAFAAREVFVSTLAVVYGLDASESETSATLRERVRAQRRPDGRPVFTPLTCLSLMVFFALACQCMSTLAVLKRETGGWRWPAFLFAYMTALAWSASLVVYQGGRLIGFE